ncbi:hypothetical protein FPOA_13791 [Fusarium poae]|uniref:Uncharacterized protein n=1 Tax=Fusarium poae TaxID=36050 RepID=A0A1B8A4E4_FUSPO|nr:hypothetical protein FPOA_13791 [Fusarium poae]
MALFSPQKEGLAATLSKPGDFFDWEHAFRIQAERLDLQQYLKRKTFLRDKPAIPDIRKRKYTKTAQAQRTIRSKTQESQESTQDDIQETANGTWVVSDLTEQGQKTFQQDLSFYQLEERIFKDEKKALGTLKDWVLRTVFPSFIRTCCQPHGSIYEWHHNLRARSKDPGMDILRTGIESIDSFDAKSYEYRIEFLGVRFDANRMWCFSFDIRIEHGTFYSLSNRTGPSVRSKIDRFGRTSDAARFSVTS